MRDPRVGGVRVEAGNLFGWVHDNRTNARDGYNGFNPLFHRDSPTRTIFDNSCGGVNFEHVVNGTGSAFTPRVDPATITAEPPSAALVHWPAEGSSWGLDCTMRYALRAPNYIDLSFSMIPTKADAFPLGYLGTFWACYTFDDQDRALHFYGVRDGVEGWTTFGELVQDKAKKGNVAYHGMPPLPFREGVNNQDVIEDKEKTFLQPFYYGLLEAGGNPQPSKKGPLVFVVMFDQCETIRFSLNHGDDPKDKMAAWDWQYLVRNPVVGQRYGYRARIVLKPFVSQEDVMKEYIDWRDSLSPPYVPGGSSK